jgi:hypothetical protein
MCIIQTIPSHLVQALMFRPNYGDSPRVRIIHILPCIPYLIQLCTLRIILRHLLQGHLHTGPRRVKPRSNIVNLRSHLLPPSRKLISTTHPLWPHTMANKPGQYLRRSPDLAWCHKIQDLMNVGPPLCGILVILMVLGTERSEII